MNKTETVLRIINHLHVPDDLAEIDRYDSFYWKTTKYFYHIKAGDRTDYFGDIDTLFSEEEEGDKSLIERLVVFNNFATNVRMLAEKADNVSKLTWKQEVFDLYMDAMIDQEYRDRFMGYFGTIEFFYVDFRHRNGTGMKKEDFFVHLQDAGYILVDVYDKSKTTMIDVRDIDCFFLRLWKLQRALKVAHTNWESTPEERINMIYRTVFMKHEDRDMSLYFHPEKLAAVEQKVLRIIGDVSLVLVPTIDELKRNMALCTV
jgi:hypothetical protein